jgi:hypothetical protein
VPFAALAYVFGRDALLWYRAGLGFGQPNLLGPTVKHATTMPQEMVADEKITWLAGAEVVVPTTVGGACVLGISVTGHATRESLAETYGEVVAEATAVFPDSQARSGCTDGFHATRAAWRRLFPRLILVLCFLHSILKMRERCRGALRRQGLDRAWWVYQATTNGGDRLHNHLDRVLYAMRYCHGQTVSARLAVRAWAMQWNFHPYSVRLRHDQPSRSSPFEDLNDFLYHPN